MIRILVLWLLLAGCLAEPPPRPDDDDDSGGTDDDDSAAGDDEPDPPLADLCSALGRATNDSYTAILCTGPVDLGPGVSSNAQYRLVTGAASLVTSPEKKD